MKYPSRSFLILPCLLLLVVPSEARDVAVVVDISGSMRRYGAWQEDVLAAISGIMRGNPPDHRWQLTGTASAFSEFHLAAGDQVLLIAFGTVLPSAQFPFFSRILGPFGPNDLPRNFPQSEREYAEARTNKTLAEAVAARKVSARDSPAFVIMISDFLIDAELGEQQLRFVNEVQSSFAVYTLATLSWNSDPRVQIKLLKYVPHVAVSAEPESGGALRLLPAKYLEQAKSLWLSWKFEGNAVPKRYAVVVRDARTARILFSKGNLAGTSITYMNATAGLLKWTVTAELQNGSSVQQTATTNVPGAPVGGDVLLLLLVVGALLAAAIWWLNKAGALPRWMQFAKKKDSTEV